MKMTWRLGVSRGVILSAAFAAPVATSGCPRPPGGTDAGGYTDSTPGADSGVDGGGPGSDSGAGCGIELLPTGSIYGTEGIAIAADGTLYYSQANAIGRRVPGGAPDDAWVSLPGAGTVWGLALAPGGMLYVGSPATGIVYSIDTTVASPTAGTLYSPAGSPNGVTIGPDGAVYYGDFNTGSVYRVTTTGTRTEVTASPVASANGLLFDPDGTLLVLSYSAGTIWRLTLDSSMQETGRAMAGSASGGAVLDGIARDTSGRYYVTDNGAGRLLRFDSSFGNEEMLLSGISAAANIAFGKGALDCVDVYVASAGALGRYHGDTGGTP